MLQLYVIYTLMGEYAFFILDLNPAPVNLLSKFLPVSMEIFFMQYFVVFLISSCTSLQECAVQANLILQFQNQTLGACVKKSQYTKLSCL